VKETKSEINRRTWMKKEDNMEISEIGEYHLLGYNAM
jgi:hypothetical protein